MDDLTPYHESGHVLMAILLGGRVPHATIEPDRDDGPDRHGDVRVLWLALAAAAIVPEERKRLAWLETQVRRVHELLDICRRMRR